MPEWGIYPSPREIDRFLDEILKASRYNPDPRIRGLAGPARGVYNVGKELLRPRLGSSPNILGTGRDRNTKVGRTGASARAPSPTPIGAGDQNPLGMLYDQLLDMLTGGSGVDESALMDQVRGQLDPIYDQRINQARGTYGRGKEDISGMYSALAADYERLAPEQEAQAEEAQQEVEDLYGQLKSNIEGNYARVSQEQVDTMKQLGIEAAAPGVMKPQGERAASAMSRADELGAINQQRYQDIANIDETYYREGSPLASLTGANRVSDLATQLQDYVQQTEAERTSGINQAYSQLLQQAQGQAAQEQNQRTQMLWQILQAQLQAQSQPQGEMSPFEMRTSLPGEAQQALRSIERSEPAVTGRQEIPGHPVPGTYSPITDEWWLNQVDEMYAAGDINETTRQLLMQYIMMTRGQ